MTPGARYRAKSSGSVYEVVRMGTSLIDPCVLRLVEMSDVMRSSVVAELGRAGRPHELLRDCDPVFTKEAVQRLEVEPAWFEHAATEVK